MSFGLSRYATAGLSLLSDAETRSISAENPNGGKGRGGMATEGTGAGCARDLGQGWKVSPSTMILPGEEKTLASIEGSGMIRSIWISGYVGREFILRFYWDHQEQPSVECPLTDFFANGWSDNSGHMQDSNYSQVSSIPVAVNPNKGLNCFWEMPFRQQCRITMTNRGPAERTCYYQINYELCDVPAEAAYFHAQFRLSKPLARLQDHTILDGVRGMGHYVGTSLCVGLNTDGGWWGEGEVKFFLDDDAGYPTICGTGTEDYFGGAYNWDVSGKYTTYTTPYLGMHQVIRPDGLYHVQQRFSMYRWHIPDPIHFKLDIKVTIQDLGWRPDGRYLPRQDDFASVAYWYQSLPAQPFPALPGHDLIQII